MASTELTFLVKGINGPAHGAVVAAIFEKLLAYGKPLDGELPASNDTLLFQLFDLDIEPGKDIPVAAVTRLLDLGVVDKSWWLRADPVHLVAGRQGLLMVANEELELTSQEAEGLVHEIMQAMTDEGWVLKAPNPHRWYLKPADVPDITTTPLDVVMGQDIERYLPGGPDAKAWHTRLNEIQILLHTSQINIDREAADRLAANSVWFWGGGSLPQLKTSPWAAVWSDDVVSLSLARLSDTQHHKFVTDPKQWHQQAAAGNHLLVIDSHRFTNSADELDRVWGEWLLATLKSADLERVTIYLGTGRGVTIRPADIRKRWNWRFPFGRR